MKSLLLSCLAALALPLATLRAAPPTQAFYHGAAYYPELWPEANIDRDIREMKSILRKLEMDVICFRDIRQLKQSLGGYHIEPLDDDELDMPDDVEAWARAPLPVGRRRRR